MALSNKVSTSGQRNRQRRNASSCQKAFPAKALFERLHQVGELPTWAVYLPASLHLLMRDQSWVTPPGASSSKHSSGKTTAVRGEQTPKSLADAGSSDGTEVSAEPGARQPREEAWWSGRVWTLSRDPAGCREVQAALDCARSEEERLAIAAELQGRISEALRCPHANYVLQKCITVLKPRHLQFIVDEILCKGTAAVAHVARHKYGCRIIQRLLENLPPVQVHGLVEGLLSDTIATCKHPYGNYVMQHVLEHGTSKQRHDLIDQLTQDVLTVGKDSYACEVVGKAMAIGAREDLVHLARALLAVPGLISLTARTCPHKLILRALEGPEQEEARFQINSEGNPGRRLKYRAAEQQLPRRGRRSHP